MKKTILFTALSAIIAALALSCATTQLTDISEAIGKDWKLIEVRVNNRDTEFDRRNLNREGAGDIFTIRIDEDLVSGTGAPNRYSAPYTVSEEDRSSVQIAIVRSTLMAALFQPEKLKEHDFFVYIQNTYKWGLSEGILVLHSKTESGDEVIMRFTL